MLGYRVGGSVLWAEDRTFIMLARIDLEFVVRGFGFGVRTCLGRGCMEIKGMD